MKSKILCCGVFDIFHIGHLEYLQKSKLVADVLIVSVTADDYVNKGKNRPFFSENHRAGIIEKLNFVDLVIINRDYTVENLIRTIRPDYFAKGMGCKNIVSKNLVIEKRAIQEVGGAFVLIDSEISSSTKIAELITQEMA